MHVNKMMRFVGKFLLTSMLVMSLFFNGALLFSEVAFTMAYRILSSAVSTVYDGAQLSSSIGWKQTKLIEKVETYEKEISKSLENNKKLIIKVDNLEKKGRDIQKQADLVKEKIRKKEIEVRNLKNANGNLTQSISKKELELTSLKADYKDLDNQYKNTLSKVDNLKITNNNIKNDLLKTQKSLDSLKIDLTSSKSSNSVLEEKLSKNGLQIESLNKKAARQIDEINATRKLVTEATEGVSKRIVTRVTRNLGAMPLESVPVAGIAVTVGLIYLEIQDACDTMGQFKELTSKLGIEDVNQKEDTSFCSFTKDELFKLASNEKKDFSKCWDQTKSLKNIEIVDLVECLPEKEPLPNLPTQPDDTNTPSREQL